MEAIDPELGELIQKLKYEQHAARAHISGDIATQYSSCAATKLWLSFSYGLEQHAVGMLRIHHKQINLK